MRPGKRERERLRKERADRSLIDQIRNEKARACVTAHDAPSYLGPLSDRTRDPIGTRQVQWEYRTLYFTGMPRKSKVRAA